MPSSDPIGSGPIVAAQMLDHAKNEVIGLLDELIERIGRSSPAKSGIPDETWITISGLPSKVREFGMFGVLEIIQKVEPTLQDSHLRALCYACVQKIIDIENLSRESVKG